MYQMCRIRRTGQVDSMQSLQGSSTLIRQVIATRKRATFRMPSLAFAPAIYEGTSSDSDIDSGFLLDYILSEVTGVGTTLFQKK